MIKEDLLFFIRNNHIGQENYITSSELELLFGINGASIRQIISKLRCEGQPICSDANGYYYAENHDEINNTATQLLGRTKKINEAVRGLILSHQVFYDGKEGIAFGNS